MKWMMRSVSTQVRSDLKAARKLWLPWQLLLPLMALSFGACVVLDHYGMLNMTLPVLNCGFFFGLLIYLKWGLRGQPLFWATIAALAAIHAMLIWCIPWTSDWVPAAAIAVISSIDFAAMLWTLAAVEVLVGGQLRGKT